MHILLVGSGQMAQAVQLLCQQQGVKMTKFGQDFDYSTHVHGKPIAIHFGSGRLLPDLIKLCVDLSMPLIQGSTRLSVPLPKEPPCAIIYAPNLALPMVRFISAFPAFAQAIRPGMDMHIFESHQVAKADTSGTARQLSKQLDVPIIESVRNESVSLELGVPPQHLNGHAYHYFRFFGQGVEIKVTTKIHGREPYAQGVLTLARGLEGLSDPLLNGLYQLKDVMHLFS